MTRPNRKESERIKDWLYSALSDLTKIQGAVTSETGINDDEIVRLLIEARERIYKAHLRAEYLAKREGRNA